MSNDSLVFCMLSSLAGRMIARRMRANNGAFIEMILGTRKSFLSNKNKIHILR